MTKFEFTIFVGVPILVILFIVFLGFLGSLDKCHSYQSSESDYTMRRFNDAWHCPIWNAALRYQGNYIRGLQCHSKTNTTTCDAYGNLTFLRCSDANQTLNWRSEIGIVMDDECINEFLREEERK